MPALRNYDVFITHAWDHNDHYHRLVALLDGAPNFAWTNHSVPEHAPITEKDLEYHLHARMRDVHVVLAIAGVHASRRDWIEYEVKFARRIGRPIIGVLPYGAQRTSSLVDAHAVDMVSWSTVSIVEAIRQHALIDRG